MKRLLTAVSLGALIVGVAAVFRWPSLDESLWVDELHSAWTVAGSSGEVFARAVIGNQSPWYFWLLWAWSQWAGDTELALRGPSVIAGIATCGLLALTAARVTGSRAAAMAVGLTAAVDRNAIFFTTEARGYAFVMLAVAALLWCGCRWLQPQNRRAVATGAALSDEAPRGAGRDWGWAGAVFAAALSAVLMHITAAAAVAAACLGLLCAPCRLAERESRRIGLLIAAGSGVGLGILLSAPSVWHVWQRRAQWSAFGGADGWSDLYRLWPWGWLMAVPLLLHVARGSRAAAASRNWLRWGLGLTGAVLLVALLLWGAALGDWLSLWHRRFLIGTLPPLVLGGGLLWWGAVVPRGSADDQRASRWREWGLVLLVPLGLMFWQGTLGEIVPGRWRGVARGEPWREVLAEVAASRGPKDAVWVAPELLESRWLSDQLPSRADHLSSLQLEYLAYPTRGPYRLPGARPLGPLRTWGPRLTGDPSWLPTAEGVHWIVIRKRAARVAEVLGLTPRQGGGENAADRMELNGYGKLSVLRISAADR